MNKKKRYTVMALSALLVASTMAHNDEAKPWTFWYWMYGAVSKAGIHADLVGMKNVGLGGTYLMPIRGVSERPEYQARRHSCHLSSGRWWITLSSKPTPWALTWAFISATVSPWQAIRLSFLPNRCRRWYGPIPLWVAVRR